MKKERENIGSFSKIKRWKNIESNIRKFGKRERERERTLKSNDRVLLLCFQGRKVLAFFHSFGSHIFTDELFFLFKIC